MRYLWSGLLLAGFFSAQAVAESDTIAKLTAEGLCKEYGYHRATAEFDQCLENVLSAAAARPVQHASSGQLVEVAGDVRIAADGQAPQAVARGAPLGNDMTVSTGGNSHAVLKFVDGQVIALQENSSLRIHDYRYNPKDIKQSNMFFSMSHGGMHAINGAIGSRHPAAFRLETPNATLGVSATDFMLVIGDKMYSQVKSGLLQLDNAAGTKVLILGQNAVVTSENALPAEINANELPPNLFVNLSLIPVPDTNPMAVVKQPPAVPVPAPAPAQAVAEQPPLNPGKPVAAQGKTADEGFCENYGYVKGTASYNDCLATAAENGYSGEATKYQESTQDEGHKKRRRM